jgi:membrane-associated phospholipid phosphatase
MSDVAVSQLVQLALGVATVLALLWLADDGTPPWRVVGRTLAETARSRSRLLYAAACASILAFNYLYLELGVDAYFTRAVVAWRGADFTPLAHDRIEGDAVARVQQALACRPLTLLFAYVYVTVFPCLLFVSILVYDHWRDRRHLAMTLVGYVLNFAIVLPFYVLVPVRECFVFYREGGGGAGPAARLLLDDLSPVIMQGYRTMSGVDNCFPSFHTSLAVTVALVAWDAGRRRFAWLVGSFAAAIVFSTIYLGIHWFTDVAAGVLVGWAAYRLARTASRRWAGEGAGSETGASRG